MMPEGGEIEETARAVEASGERFLEHFRFLTERDLESPRRGGWSPAQLLAHVVAWHEECLWALRATIEGNYERRDYSDVDDWNRRAVERFSGSTGRELLEKATETNRLIAETLREVPLSLWEAKPRVREWAVATTVRHYAEHLEDLTDGAAE